jgi:hypothetical protein
MRPAPLLGALLGSFLGQHGVGAKTWCETNVQGMRFPGDEIAPPVRVDSYDDCAEECGKHAKCRWIDWNSETKDCLVKSGQGSGAVVCDSCICGHCYQSQDPPAPLSTCRHEHESCSLTDLCCTEGTLSCSISAASGTSGS